MDNNMNGLLPSLTVRRNLFHAAAMSLSQCRSHPE